MTLPESSVGYRVNTDTGVLAPTFEEPPPSKSPPAESPPDETDPA